MRTLPCPPPSAPGGGPDRDRRCAVGQPGMPRGDGERDLERRPTGRDPDGGSAIDQFWAFASASHDSASMTRYWTSSMVKVLIMPRASLSFATLSHLLIQALCSSKVATRSALFLPSSLW